MVCPPCRPFPGLEGASVRVPRETAHPQGPSLALWRLGGSSTGPCHSVGTFSMVTSFQPEEKLLPWSHNWSRAPGGTYPMTDTLNSEGAPDHDREAPIPGPSGGRCGKLVPGCHHDCFLSCTNGETVWNGAFVLAFFYLWREKRQTCGARAGRAGPTLAAPHGCCGSPVRVYTDYEGLQEARGSPRHGTCHPGV